MDSIKEPYRRKGLAYALMIKTLLKLKEKGITFVREPKEEPYGIVAVLEDLYGNLLDLIQYKKK